MIDFKMASSTDSLDFCPEIPIIERNAIPLDCWQEINLSDIWIPSHFLPNRNKSNSMKVHHGIYHTLEKKDSSKYAISFSVYSFNSTENGQGEIFVSDSDDDIFGSDPNSFEKIQISDNTLPSVANNSPLSSVCSNNLKNSTEIKILKTNLDEDKRHLNSKENSIVNGRNSPYLDEICQEENIRMIMNSSENLINKRNEQQNDNKVCGSSLSNSIHTGSQKHFATSKENHGAVETCGFEDRLNKNADSVSLKDILDDAPEINIKDSVFDFKKKDDPFLLSLYNKKEKKAKKNKKDKGKKKTYIVLDNFLETKTASQDYYCDKYFQSILKDKQKDASCNNAHLGSNMDFPRLATNEHMFSQSDKRKKEASCSNVHVGSNMEFPYLASNECMFTQSDKSEKEASCNNVDMRSNMEFPYLASNELIFTQSDKSEKEASCSNVHVGNNMEFPYLASDECMFTQSDKREENIESTLSDLECGLIEAKEINENIDVKEINAYATDVICGKIVIENIPHDTTQDDILAILCGYGEIKKFSLVSTGNFFTAYVEIDLICDIDWIIECLNGSEPFGASTEKIYCYKQ